MSRSGQRNQRVIARFLEPDAAAQCRRVGALRKQPFRARLDSGFIEQERQRYAGHSLHEMRPCSKVSCDSLTLTSSET